MRKNVFNLVRLVDRITTEKNISVAEFAKRMGISKQSAYNVYFLGNNSKSHNQSISTIITIADALEIDPIDVFLACLADRKEFLC